MDTTAALRAAVDLMQVPSRVRAYRDEPLPAGMDLLLRVAAGLDDALTEAEDLLGRPAETLRQAATFFVEQILLAPHTDSYRILGSTQNAATLDLRRNMTLLLRWLHPDVAADEDRSVFATRVASAWDSVKTDDRRTAYDSLLADAAGRAEAGSLHRRRRPSAAYHSANRRGETHDGAPLRRADPPARDRLMRRLVRFFSA